ncbi:ABC transporter substrate-binding protein [Halobium palmae]|uniref:ABC transporter substrate-binding protein n=1 Tax=Halobium palmae TaxID=1776492 RepID=A0ABD5RXP7_9EURY
MSYDSTRRRTLKLTGGVAASGLAGLAGCAGVSSDSSGSTDGSNSTDNSGGSEELTSVVHGATNGGTTGILTSVMVAQGFDKDHGLSLQTKGFASPPKVQQQLVFNEDIPTGYMGSIVATRMHSKGESPQLIGPYMLYHAYIVTRSDTDIEGPADLAGQQISFASEAADAWLKFVVMLDEAHGVSRDQYEFVQAAPPAALSLLEKGELDAILTYEPLMTKALLQYDFETVFSPREAWNEAEDLPLTTVDLAWTKEWYDANPDAGVGLAKAFIDTQQYLNENVDSVIEEYSDSIGLENQEQIDLAKERLVDIYPSEWDIEAFQESERLMVQKAYDRGLIEAEPTDDIFNEVL